MHQLTKFQHNQAAHGWDNNSSIWLCPFLSRAPNSQMIASLLRGPNCAKCRKNVGQSSALNQVVLNFICVAPFPNKSDLKATMVKRLSRISQFSPPVKIRGRMGKLEPLNLWYIFGDGPLAELGDYVSVVKSTAVKYKASTLVGRLNKCLISKCNLLR